jgi:hypothetical protein
MYLSSFCHFCPARLFWRIKKHLPEASKQKARSGFEFEN